MIIDHNDDVLKQWTHAYRNLLIQAKPGNGKIQKGLEIINEMMSLNHSVVLLTNGYSVWGSGLNKTKKMSVFSYDQMRVMGKMIEVDLLIIDDHYEVMDDFPIKMIKYTNILILSDESHRIPDFFNGATVRIINWENINRTETNGELNITYHVESNSAFRNKKIKLSVQSDEKLTEIEFPVEELKRFLLK